MVGELDEAVVAVDGDVDDLADYVDVSCGAGSGEEGVGGGRKGGEGEGEGAGGDEGGKGEEEME